MSAKLLADALELSTAAAPIFTSGRAGIYANSTDGLLYTVDGNGLTLKLHAASSLRTSSNVAGLSSPVIGDCAYDTTLNLPRFYLNTGWSSMSMDALVVHLAGSEVVTGTKTWNASQTTTDNTYAWGDATHRFTQMGVVSLLSGAASLSLQSNVASSGSAIGIILKNNTALGAGDEIVQFQDSTGAQKAAVTYNGTVLSPALDAVSAGALTLGGTTATSIALQQNVTMPTGKTLVVGANTLISSDQLAASKLLISGQTTGDLLYASSSTAWARLADAATGQVLISGGAGAAPSYSASPTVTTLTGSTSVLTPLLDAAAATALTLGTTNATSIALQQNITVPTGKTLTVGTNVLFGSVADKLNAAKMAIAAQAIGDLLYADTSSTFARLADVAAGSYLVSGGVGVAPAWSTLTLPNSATTGDLFYASGSNAMGNLADVAVGSYLRSGGVGSAPVWSTLTLPNAATQGDLLYATGSNAIGRLADVATGQLLTSGGVGANPAWSASPTVTTLTGSTSVLTPLLDANSAGTLSIGTSTATGITLGASSIPSTVAGNLLVGTKYTVGVSGGTLSKYNNEATAGVGHSYIEAVGQDVASSGAGAQSTTITSYMPLASGLYEVQVVVSATTADTVSVTVTYTDAVNTTAQTIVAMSAVSVGTNGTASARILCRANTATTIVAFISNSSHNTTKASAVITRTGS